MSSTTKLALKPTSATSMPTNLRLAQSSNSQSLLPLLNITNLVNKLNSTLDNNDKKTNIIINFCYIE